MRLWVLLGLLAPPLFGFSTFAQADSCIDWPTVMAKFALRRIPSDAVKIVVKDFQNATGQPGDDWLRTGIPWLLQQYLMQAPHLAPIPENLARHLDPKKIPPYAIGGEFQRRAGSLRIFVQLYRKKLSDFIFQYPVEFPYPGHRQFFVGLRGAAEAILKWIRVEDIEKLSLGQVEQATSNTRAFENFIKGWQSFISYDPSQVEVAIVWFNESRAQDYGYPWAYLGLIQANSFLGLAAKQQGLAFGGYYQKAQAAQGDMKEFSRHSRLEEKKQESHDLEPRFLVANVHFVSALHAVEGNQITLAAEGLQNAVRYAPEDAAAHYTLSQIYDKLGKTSAAAKARKRALEINPCLE